MEPKRDVGRNSGDAFWESWLARHCEANPLVRLLRRIYSFVKRNGMFALRERVELELRHLIRGHRMVMFYFDWLGMDEVRCTPPPDACIERIKAASCLAPSDLAQILMSGDSLIIKSQVEERFAKGASLWLYKVQDHVAGFGWTLVGCTVEPYFFPLTPHDVHFFDFFVVPEYRGKRINPALVNGILEQLQHLAKGRAYIECAQWNQPQLASLRYTLFKQLGVASKHTLFGRTIVSWWEHPKYSIMGSK